MKEYPIFFNDEMVRAILDGRKTQTRRPIKLPKKRDSFVLLDYGDGLWPYQSDDGESPVCNDGNEHPYNSPYGYAGDRLWVRECFADDMGGAAKRLGDHLCYRADPLHPVFADGGWTPSIHMPRWASRLTLENTNVRVERLQDISEEDAIAEGLYSNEEYRSSAGDRRLFDCPVCHGDQVHEHIDMNGATEIDCNHCETAAKRFSLLWKSIYGQESLENNKWAWVYEFKRIEQ